MSFEQAIFAFLPSLEFSTRALHLTGYDLTLLHPADKTVKMLALFKCRICNNFIQDPVQLDCKHILCNACWLNFERDDPNKRNLCPVCNHRVSHWNVLSKTDKMLNTLYKTCKVKCHYECGLILNPKRMRYHQLWGCQNRPIDCCWMDCKEVLPYKEIIEHVRKHFKTADEHENI